MTVDPDKKLDDCVFCALDLETTGINPLTHRIVEVGLVRFTLKEIIETYEQLVDPGMPIPPDVIRIHGITDEMVAGAPRIADIRGNIAGFFADSILVIHNPYFDLAFIDRCFREDGCDAPRFEAFDTVRLARKAFPFLQNHRLATLGKHFKISGSNHRALSDALCCMEVFRQAIVSRPAGEMRTLRELLKYHGKPVRPRPGKTVVVRNGRRNGLTIGQAVRIRYADSGGMVTERNIVPLEFISRGKTTYLRAHCLLRKEIRFFNRDGILEVL